MKISQRFSLNHSPLWRLSAPQFNFEEASRLRYQAWIDSTLRSILRVNFSVQFSESYTSGYSDNHGGNYTGILGNVKRHEADMGLHIVRPASLQHEVVKLGPAVFPCELAVLTSRQLSGSADYSFLDFLSNQTQFLVLIVGFIIAAILAFAITAKNRSTSVENFVRQYSEAMEQVAETILDQENASHALWSQRILWLSTCVAIFVIVFGYLVSYVSTDQLIERPSKTLDTVDDLFSPGFAKMRLVMSRNFLFFEHMQSADPQSRSGQLFARMSRGNNCSQPETCNLMHFSTNDLAKVSPLALALGPEFVEGHAGFLFDREIVQQSRATVGCKINPKMNGTSVIDRLHVSRDNVVSDYSSVYFSHKADKQVVKYVSYVVQTLLEAGLISKSSLIAADIIIGGLIPTDDHYYQCASPPWPTIESEATPFTLMIFATPFKFMGKLLGASVALLLLETLGFFSQSNPIMAQLNRVYRKRVRRERKAMLEVQQCVGESHSALKGLNVTKARMFHSTAPLTRHRCTKRLNTIQQL
ncbi:hypothetical protein HDE_08876 [Halotydeus destructor]|nr:hypothetical protein HDE_08876 [Halotydeus destructor]